MSEFLGNQRPPLLQCRQTWPKPCQQWNGRSSESAYSSRNEVRTANSMLAIMFVFASSVVRETAVPFSIFMSHPNPLFTVNDRNSSNGVDHHVEVPAWVFS
jgi:hypothetical protein